MQDASILIFTLAVQQLLFGLGWWLVAQALPDARVALRHFAAFSWVCGLALLLFTDGVREIAGESTLVLRNTGLVMAFMLLRRGLLSFTRQALREPEQWALLLAYVAVVTVLSIWPIELPLRAAALSAVLSWVLLRTAYELQRGGRPEFGALTVAMVGSPLLLIGLAMALRMVLALLRPDSGASTITQATQFNVALMLGLVVLAAGFHFALGYLVMRRMVADLQHLSSHDALTQLLNRRAFEQRLEQEIAASLRSAAPLGLLMIDIDHFKAINDRFGHPGGDTALRQVAERLARAARANDVVARLGGEEFGVLLPATDAAGIRQAAERLRRAVAREAIAIGAQRHTITVSVGASMRLPLEREGEAMLQRADQALYSAKSEGRDRVVFDTLVQVSETPLAQQPDSQPALSH